MNFEVLTDLGSTFAKEIGIVFELPESLRPIYDSFGIDVVSHNGDYNLPIPATFVLDSNKKVVFSYIDLDYTKRLDPEKIVSFLKEQN